ncbi:MAG: hypothetical protein M3126_07610 [Candidatus Eremiobacteraeota bacterium]|nr:hypothetical protein [Candidatus Eremiobacteraeota bacterium]
MTTAFALPSALSRGENSRVAMSTPAAISIGPNILDVPITPDSPFIQHTVQW